MQSSPSPSDFGQLPGQADGQGPRIPFGVRTLFPFALLCMFGLAAIVIAQYLGVCVAAFGATVLFSCKRDSLAYVCALCGIGTAFVFGVGTGASALIVGGGAVLICRVCAKGPAEGKIVAIAAAQIALAVLADAVTLAMQGTTIWDLLSSNFDAQIEQLVATGSLTRADESTLSQLKSLILGLWPMIYLVQGSITAALVTVTSVLTCRAVDASYSARVKPFAKFDTSPHVVWPLILGLVCVAAANIVSGWANELVCAGVVAMMVTRILCLVQGCALVRFLQERHGMRLGGRVVTWLLAIMLDMVFMVVSFVGLVDIWLNIRKLDRDDVAKRKAA